MLAGQVSVICATTHKRTSLACHPVACQFRQRTSAMVDFGAVRAAAVGQIWHEFFYQSGARADAGRVNDKIGLNPSDITIRWGSQKFYNHNWNCPNNRHNFADYSSSCESRRDVYESERNFFSQSCRLRNDVCVFAHRRQVLGEQLIEPKVLA